MVIWVLPIAPGCSETPEGAGVAPLRLATTTSVESTGLLADLLAPFEQRTRLRVHVTAVGTGQALALARRGDVDAVLVHAPDAERAFMDEGHGSQRRVLMHNDFVLVGPESDPAGIRGGQDAAAALRQISGRRTAFVSRGDNSGTHMKERALWRAASLTPEGNAWYLESGQGQRLNLTVADEKQAYTLTDRATYVTARAKIGLVILVEGDALLANPYSIIAVHPEKHAAIHHQAALELIAWLSSAEGQQRIARFRPQGEALFHPAHRVAAQP